MLGNNGWSIQRYKKAYIKISHDYPLKLFLLYKYFFYILFYPIKYNSKSEQTQSLKNIFSFSTFQISTLILI
jgi:hypothetical protein